MKTNSLLAAALGCALFAIQSFGDIPYVDIKGVVTVNGVPTAGVTVEAMPCDGASLPADWPVPAPNATSTAASSGDNFQVVFVTNFGDGATPGPAGSLTFESPANGAWYTAIDVQLKFSYPGHEPVVVSCDQMRQAYQDSLATTEPGVARLNVNIQGSTPPTELESGDTAGIGFWRNKHGQKLIRSLSNDENPTALGDWLASNFSWLYGTNAGAKNVAGKSSAAVARLYLKCFAEKKGPKTEAQMLATALAVYVTDSDLAGEAGAKYGFNLSATGTGAKLYNVGSKGEDIGLVNNTYYTVLDLLQQANLQKELGTFDAKAFNSIFSGINGAGSRD